MDYLHSIFKAVNVIFAIASVATGAQAVLDPAGFSRSFGLPFDINIPEDGDGPRATDLRATLLRSRELSLSWVSFMGVRQLGTGIILLTFAYQDKLMEAATILAIIGILVAGTDGLYLARAGVRGQALFHAIPGAFIAALAGSVLYTSA